MISHAYSQFVTWRSAVVVILTALAIVFVASFANAQEIGGFRVSTVSVGSGEDALSSGLSGTIQLANEKRRMIEVTVQQEQAWLIYGPKFKLGSHVDGYAAASAGHMQGAPWVGPFLSLEWTLGKVGGQRVAVSTLQWPCFFLGVEPKMWRTENDGKPKNSQSVLIGHFAGLEVGIGPVSFSYAKLYFLDDPTNTMPGVAFTQKIRKDFLVKGSITRNTIGKRWMYFIGATWMPSD